MDGIAGKIFGIVTSPADNSGIKQGVLMVPPFAEEMNKTRRMMSQQANQFAEKGFSVMQFDYLGTGDSEGDFADATWDIWSQDIIRLLEKFKAEGVTSVVVLGLRMGSLFTELILSNSPVEVSRVVLWQPVTNGEMLLNQFYRLKFAADMIGDSDDRTTVKQIKENLANDVRVEIAGYMLNPKLTSGLEKQRLDTLSSITCPAIHWIEIVAAQDRPVPPASQRVMDKLQEAGVEIQSHTIAAPPFWATVELTDVDELHKLTNNIIGHA